MVLADYKNSQAKLTITYRDFLDEEISSYVEKVKETITPFGFKLDTHVLGGFYKIFLPTKLGIELFSLAKDIFVSEKYETIIQVNYRKSKNPEKLLNNFQKFVEKHVKYSYKKGFKQSSIVLSLQAKLDNKRYPIDVVNLYVSTNFVELI